LTTAWNLTFEALKQGRTAIGVSLLKGLNISLNTLTIQGHT